MQIKELFVNKIDRDIDPVIKVFDHSNITQELEEYVVTEKIEKNLMDFFDAYNETAFSETKNIGVWVSGYFGSGKSHFAKILGYLLENRKLPDGRRAIEVFHSRLGGLDYETEIKAYLHEANTKITSHVIMFQIEAEHDQLEEKKSILKVLYRQFLKYIGLSDDLHIANLEHELIYKGKYNEFKDKIREITGKEWEDVRKSKLFSRRPIAKALFELFPDEYSSEEDAKEAYDLLGNNIELTIKKVAKNIMEYIQYLEEEKGEISPHFVFIIDEMGQYIGDSDDLLLELQSISEVFGTTGKGKIWLIVTSQERLDEIIESVKGKKTDYAKIMDRFALKLHLTSDNIMKVLHERILKKKEQVKPELLKLYSNYEGNITYASKMEDANRTLRECNENSFISSYPFLPYQLELTENILASIRKEGGHRKLIGTERSMIGITQGILISPETKFKDSEIGRLVTFYEIFDMIGLEIPSETLRDVNSVKINIDGDQDIAKQALKTLYLLQWVTWIPKTARNIAKAMINHVDVDVATLEKKVVKALDKLVEAKYAIKENGQYEYISGAKKKLKDEISRVIVKRHEIKRYAAEVLKNIFDTPRVRYKGIRYFDVRIYGDDNEFFSKGEVELRVYSPIFLEYGTVSIDEIKQESHKHTNTVYWLPDPHAKIASEIERLKKTEKVVNEREKHTNKSAEEIALLKEERRNIELMKEGIEKAIRKSLINGIIIYYGNDDALSGRSDIKTIFEREIGGIIPYIYTKLDLAKVKVSEKSIKAILESKSSELYNIERELDLFDKNGEINLHSAVVGEVFDKIKETCDRGDFITGKELLEYFDKAPYGWDPILVRIVVTALFRSGIIYLRYNGKDYIDFKRKESAELLINSKLFKKCTLLYEEEDIPSLEERQTAQKLLDIIFDVKTDDTINSLASHIEEQLEKMKRVFEKQKFFWDHNGYVLKDIFYKTDEIVDTVLEQVRPSKRVKKFLEVADTIKEVYRYQEKISQFMNNDETKLLSNIKNLPPSISVNSVVIDKEKLAKYRDHIQEIDAVISNREILEKWAIIVENYTKAIEIYRDIYNTLHQNKNEIYYDMIREFKEDKSLSEILNDDILNPIREMICSNFSWDSMQMKCRNCNLSLHEIDNHILAYDKKYDLMQIAIKNVLRAKKEDYKVRKKISLRAISKKTVIKTEEDLKELLDNIEREIKAILDKGEVVVIE